MLSVNGALDDTSYEIMEERMQSPTGSPRWLAATLSSEACIASVSPGADQFAGYSARDLIGGPISRLLAHPSAFEVLRILDLVKSHGFWEGEVICRCRDGNQRNGRCSIAFLAGDRDRQGEYLLICSVNDGVGQDSNDDLSVTDIAARVRAFAHDLNNPLAVVMGFTQLIILDHDCPGGVRSDVEKVYAELKRMARIVEELQRYALSLCDQSPRSQVSKAAV